MEETKEKIKKSELTKLLRKWPDTKKTSVYPKQLHRSAAYKAMLLMETSKKGKRRSSVVRWLYGKYTTSLRQEELPRFLDKCL